MRTPPLDSHVLAARLVYPHAPSQVPSAGLMMLISPLPLNVVAKPAQVSSFIELPESITLSHQQETAKNTGSHYMARLLTAV